MLSSTAHGINYNVKGTINLLILISTKFTFYFTLLPHLMPTNVEKWIETECRPRMSKSWRCPQKHALAHTFFSHSFVIVNISPKTKQWKTERKEKTRRSREIASWMGLNGRNINKICTACEPFNTVKHKTKQICRLHTREFKVTRWTASPQRRICVVAIWTWLLQTLTDDISFEEKLATNKWSKRETASHVALEWNPQRQE